MSGDAKKPAKKKKVPNAQPPPLELPAHCKPTVMRGGVKRMIEIWNQMRAINTGAYGSGVLPAPVAGWTRSGEGGKLPVTACSPFTANVIGILFDPKATAFDTAHPMYDGDDEKPSDGKTPLPSTFSSLHNGNYKKGDLAPGIRRNDVNHSAGSCLYYNLGYEIQPKDLRRGDMVGIDWASGGGHAVFIWDVHLAEPKDGDKYREVDCFSYLSANGRIKKVWEEPGDPANPKMSAADPKKERKYRNDCYGPGVSIGGCTDRKYLTGSDRFGKEPAKGRDLKVTVQKAMDPLFMDRPDHIKDAHWHCIPGKSKGDVNPETWAGLDKKHAPTPIDYSAGPHSVRSLRCVRFWGIAPPQRDGETPYEQTQFLLAKKLAYEEPPESYATGTPSVAPPTYEKVPVVTVKNDPELAKNSPPKKAEQPKKDDKILEQQMWVERALGDLFDHGWLKTDPGDRTNPNDAESKAAIKEFQQKFKCDRTDGNMTKKTRAKMEAALRDLEAGKDDPNAPPPPTPKTSVERIVWLRNRVEKGGAMYFAVHGYVTKLNSVRITFTCRKTKKTFTMPADIELDQRGVISRPIGLPSIFDDGCELLASFAGKGSDGVEVKYDSKVPLYIGPPLMTLF